MARRLRAEDVLGALETLLKEGSGTSTEEIRDELVASWPAGEEAPVKQAVYSHLRRMEERGEVVSRRVGVDGGGQRAVWSLAPVGAETPPGGPIEDRDVSNPGPEEIGPQNDREAEHGEG